MLIYKILQPAEWDVLRENGASDGAPIDIADGYIHFSTQAQLRETVEKHFATSGDLILATVEADRLGDALKWEVSRGGALFPHLYRQLRLDDVVSHVAIERVGDGHVLPPEIP